MVSRQCLVGLCILFALPALAADEKPWVLKGRVLDERGRPVADVAVTTVWNANGVTIDELKRIQKEAGDPSELTANEGKLEPWGRHPTKTNGDGGFSMTMQGSDYKLLAVDEERRRGALIIVDPRNPPKHLDVELVRLVRVHGRARIADSNKEFKDLTVLVGLPLNEKVPLGGDRLMICSSTQSRFEFHLPPGDYQFEAFGHDPPDYKLANFTPIKVTGVQRDVDAGFLELTPDPPGIVDLVERAKKQGTWVEIAKRYGQPAPRWHVADARGIPKGTQASDFKGKWLLIYFWGPW